MSSQPSNSQPSKSNLKSSLLAEQEGLCALTDSPLPIDMSLVDADRINGKASGGLLSRANIQVVDPVAHMAKHENLRERTTTLDELKCLFDDRVQVMRLQLKINNQILAYKRRVDSMSTSTLAFLESQLIPVQARLSDIDKDIARAIKSYPDKLVETALKVPGLGPITVTGLTIYIDLHKASTPSALWKYVGIHCASHERYVKGQAGGGNKTLRTVLWNTANVMMKMRDSGYREVYDRTKTRLAISEKTTGSRNTQGQLIECMWKDTKPSHRHGAALRAVIKHLLADYWIVGRTLAGLPTVPLYAESMLGHTHIISPDTRGWKY